MRKPPTMALALAACAIVLAPGCNVSINSGRSVTEPYDVADFTEIAIHNAFEADIVVGRATSVEVVANEEVLDNVDVQVDNGRLTVGLGGALVSTSGPLIVRITTPDVTALSVDGAAKVVIDGLDADSFDLSIDGASDVSIDGTVGRLTLDANGASNAHLEGLTVGRADITVDGATTVAFDRLDQIDGSVSGASSVDVPDSAIINATTSGASTID